MTPALHAQTPKSLFTVSPSSTSFPCSINLALSLASSSFNEPSSLMHQVNSLEMVRDHLLLHSIRVALAGALGTTAQEGTGDSEDMIKPGHDMVADKVIQPGVEHAEKLSITIHVKSNDGTSEPCYFKLSTTTRLRKLMNCYCDKMKVDPSIIAFVFDGRRLQAEHTPLELQMEDGDEIDVFLHSMGG